MSHSWLTTSLGALGSPVGTAKIIKDFCLWQASPHGPSAPEVKDRVIKSLVDPIFKKIAEATLGKIQKKLVKDAGKFSEDPQAAIANLLTETIDVYVRVFTRAKDASFADDKSLPFESPSQQMSRRPSCQRWV